MTGEVHVQVIEVENLVRKFDGFTAVNGVTFDVAEGEIFGFLGPNGAGKSTTINMLCTLLKPTGGVARVNGFDVASRQGDVRRSIGLIFQDPTLDERLTGWQNLQFHAMLYDVPQQVFEERSKELLEMVDLTDKVREDVRSFSGGMKRRLEIARGLLHRPKVLFLDEPTIGLDPQTRRHIWEYLAAVRDNQHLTLFLTTHYMDEAEICDRIAIIDHGEIVALDTPEKLKAMVGGDVVTVCTSADGRAAEVLATLGVETQPVEGGIRVETDHGAQFIPRMMHALDQAPEPIAVSSVDLHRPTLEDVFVKLTGRAIREEEASAHDMMRRQVQMRRRR
jgi:ABC-2 type transport system ATP-binding protein